MYIFLYTPHSNLYTTVCLYTGVYTLSYDKHRAGLNSCVMKCVAFAFQEVSMCNASLFLQWKWILESVDSNPSTKNGSNVFLFWWNIKGLEYLSQFPQQDHG